MNDTQMHLFLQDFEHSKNDMDAAIEDVMIAAYLPADSDEKLRVTFEALAFNCNTLVRQLRETRSAEHKLREQLKKYEPQTTL